MKKWFICQKIAFVAYTIILIAVFVTTLGFMTNYAVLENLYDPANAQIVKFHKNVLSEFNNFIFWCSVAGLVGLLLCFPLQIFKKLPDLFAYIIGLIGTIPTFIASIYSFINLPRMKTKYNKFDFDAVNKELQEMKSSYTPSTSTFDITQVIYIVAVAICIIFIVALTVNYMNGRKLKEQEEMESCIYA